jgi:hypothetical protein
MLGESLKGPDIDIRDEDVAVTAFVEIIANEDKVRMATVSNSNILFIFLSPFSLLFLPFN